jgi:mannose-6-phosphate isomerase class I
MGFKEDIEPLQFRRDLDESNTEGKELDIDQYVKSLPAKQHDLFLIPNGTVHSAGAGCLVLEVSATPYIFTFKMYDWQRMDLEGNPRPINIDHAFNNLNFERRGARVEQELLSHPYILCSGGDWSVYHLPTHAEHFYDIHRMEFSTEISVENNDVCHILMLVEGSSVSIETGDGTLAIFQYAETFVVPAAAGTYKLVNRGAGVAKVVKAFVK